MMAVTYDPTTRTRVASSPAPSTASVVRVDGSRAWATPIGEDPTRYVLGPLFGAAGVEVGDLVLIIHTDEGDWVAGRDGA